MSQENVELVRAAFSLVEIPGDPEVMIAASDPSFQMQLVGIGGGPVRYAGASGIRQWFRDVAQTWQSFRFQATELHDLGDAVLVLGDVSGRGRTSGVDVDDHWAWIVRCRNSRATSLRGFLDHDEALAAAGLGDDGLARRPRG